MSTTRLTPFSYAILVLVGREGAGPHDLRRMADRGRVYWDAAPSQWYAEPKRLAALGFLAADKTAGRTRERTHYTLTRAGREALRDWARTPAPLPRMQHEPLVRLLAADLVGGDAVSVGLDALHDELEAALRGVREGFEAGAGLPHREAVLKVNHRYATRLLGLQREWLEEAQALLRNQD